MPDIDLVMVSACPGSLGQESVLDMKTIYIICIKMEQDLNGRDKCRLHCGEAGPCEIILTGYIQITFYDMYLGEIVILTIILLQVCSHNNLLTRKDRLNLNLKVNDKKRGGGLPVNSSHDRIAFKLLNNIRKIPILECN